MALTDQVIMPGSDYQAICDATRTLTGKTATLKSGDISTELGTVLQKPETWIINEVPNFPSSTINQNIAFMTIATNQVTGGLPLYNYNYARLRIFSDGRIYFITKDGLPVDAYKQTWKDLKYRRVSFLTPPSSDLLAWLTDNAVKITNDESYSYNTQQRYLRHTVNGIYRESVLPTPPCDSLRGVIVITNIVEQATPSIDFNTTTGEITSTVTQTEAGWVKEGTKTATQQLDIQAAKTVTPSAAQQTAVASGKYTTGNVVVAAVPTEAKTVELSMPSGNQTVIPSSGKFLSAVTVKKPATMLPENIKKGVSIGGVVGTLESGGGGGAVAPKDINFYDYDGTCVAAWSLSELAGKTALPDYPTHEGLTCQGWNWTLADLKAENAKMNVGAMYITTDGKTRIYITLQEGRTSPMLGIRLEGTVTVDWGDGTTPDTLTGTNIINAKWTPTHNYASPGDYVITLTVNNGTFGIFGDSGGNLLRYTSGSDNRNYAYWSAIRRIFLGSGITTIYKNAFQYYRGLTQITLPSSITGIGSYVFSGCNSLTQITLPSGITDIGLNMFANSYSLARIILPSSITDINNYAFSACYSLTQITLPSGVTTINISAFNNCNSLTQITLPSGITSISNYAFASCGSLTQITLPNGVTSIGSSAFQACYGMAFYDFTACTAVPALSNKNAFNGIPADCKIRVPAALVSEWKAATNWATYASKIVGV